MIKTIFVDDEDIIREGICSFIDWTSLGLELAGQASNGQEALRLLDKLKPKILITDVKMPRMDGLELLRQAKELIPDCIVIIISSYDEFQYAQQALNHGAFAYLLKPIDTDHLTELLKEAVSRLEKQDSQEQLLIKAKRLLGKAADSKSTETSGLSAAVYHAKRYIEKHYQESDLRLEDVADFVYMNPSYFSTVFNREMKVSFGNYLTQIRMEKAIELLRNTSLKIYEVAEQAGYQNVSWFTVAFKKYTGKNPGEYRKNY